MEKHYRNEMKSEETIVSEEEVLSIKYNKVKAQSEEKKKHLLDSKKRIGNWPILERYKSIALLRLKLRYRKSTK
jgi:hypothetical protein